MDPHALDKLTYTIIGCAYNVHTQLGPGLLETSYEVCLEYELLKENIKVIRKVELPVFYKGIELNAGYRLDLLVEDEIILEIKAVEAIAPVHKAQLMTYLKLSGLKLGLLLNFNVTHMKSGITRVIM